MRKVKYTHKLQFCEEKDMALFARQLFLRMERLNRYVKEHQVNFCNFYSRKDVLYVDTQDYVVLNNYITTSSNLFNYKIIYNKYENKK